MLDLHAPELNATRGERLAQPAYKADFRERRQRGNRDSWKLERRQHFEESDPSPSREALRQGDWAEAMRLIDAQRAEHVRNVREDSERGAAFHRIRVVEEPLTPYVQWELHALRVQAESGTRIRVVDIGQIRDLEPLDTLLPELVSLCGHTLYEIRYTAEGVPDGAVRYTDPGLIERWEAVMKALYEAGEDLIAYIDRYVAHLPPPRLTRKAG
jgi:hypothetical protein